MRVPCVHGHTGLCDESAAGCHSGRRITLALGLAMFLKPLRKIPFSMIVSLISGGIVAYFLNRLNLSAIWALGITLVVMAILWITLTFLGIGVMITEWILSARPIMFIVGIIGMIEGILIGWGTLSEQAQPRKPLNEGSHIQALRGPVA